MKLVGISRDKDWYKIGETEADAIWYDIEKVKNFVKFIKVGDNVEIKSKKNDVGKPAIVFIKKVAGGAPEANIDPTDPSLEAPKEAPRSDAPKNTFYDKSDARGESIKRQAIGKMVATSLVSMQGQVEEGNVEALIDKLFAKFTAKVG